MRHPLLPFALLLLAVDAAAGAADRPNILWLVSEDNSTLLGCYGDPPARTPRLDKLAREGVLFERCFAQPVCAPSRFTLITGTCAVSSGPAHHMRAQGKIPPWLKGFPALLREAGYFTANNALIDPTVAPAKTASATGGRGETKPMDLRFQPDPTLPNVLLLGDSISIGYTLPVRALLKGKANVFRPLNPDGSADNCADTGRGVAELERWLAVQPRWDVIHFNWGLHDLKHMKPAAPKPTTSEDPNDPPLHRVAEYRVNLEQIVARLQRTGARLIFATTTPVPEGVKNPFRNPNDPPRYNAIAIALMKGQDIRVNDLYAFIQPRLVGLQLPQNVHFTDPGSAALAGQVAAAIAAELATMRPGQTVPRSP